MSIINKMEKRIINNGSDRFLQLTLKNEEIQEFEIGFLNTSNEDGLINVEKTIFDNSVNLKYRITGLISLDEYFMSTENTKENMLMVFSSIAEVVSKCSFLTSNKFIIESDMVFINPEEFKIKLIYLPIVQEYTINISDNFRNMIDNIASKVLIDGKVKEGSGDFIVAIKRKAQEDNLTITDLIEFAQKQSKLKSITKQTSNKDTRQSEMEKTGGEKYFIQNNNTSEKKTKSQPMLFNEEESIFKGGNGIKPKEPQVINANSNKKSSEKNDKVDENLTTEITRYKTPRIVGTIAVQPIFIGIILGILLIDGLSTVQVMGGSVLLLALDGIVIKTLLDPSKKEKVKVIVTSKSNKKNTNDTVNKEKINNEIKKTSIEKSVSEKATIQKASVMLEEETSMIEEPQIFDEETTLIGTQPYLEINNGSKTGREDIVSDNYIIGRNAGLRAWVSGSGVSREHVVIINKGNNYIIKDLKSKNGTKINGNKLLENQEISLNDGDVIEIPSLTITFRI